MALRAVLNDGQAMLGGYLHDFVHPARLTVQVNDENRLGTRGDRRFDLVGVDVMIFVGLYEGWRRAVLGDSQNRGDVRIGRHDHFVAFADSKRSHGKQQSVQPRIQSDAPARAEV